MNILVIGGAGFIGRELVDQLLMFTDHNLIVLDTDSNRLNELNLPVQNKYCFDATQTYLLLNLIEIEAIEGIVHLAANSDIKSGSMSSKLDFDNTLKTSLALAEIVKYNRFKFVLFSSTSAIYGVSEKPISIDDKLPKQPISYYGWAKLASEFALKHATQTSGTTFILTRFPNVVGPNPTHGVLYDFKFKLRQNQNEFNVLGNGEQVKPYLHVEDLCKVLIRSIQASADNQDIELNITPGGEIKLKEIVEIVLEISNLHPKVNYGETSHGWVGDVPSYSYSDGLPDHYADIKLRNSKEAIYASFEKFWHDQ